MEVKLEVQPHIKAFVLAIYGPEPVRLDKGAFETPIAKYKLTRRVKRSTNYASTEKKETLTLRITDNSS